MKLVHGIGINDFDGTISKNGIVIREYAIWVGLCRRVNSEKYHKIQKSYVDCELDEYLRSFKNFYNFIINVKGLNSFDDNGRYFQLDKDILGKCKKLYSTETISFVPSEINGFFTTRKADRGECLLGVYKLNTKYKAQISIKGKQTHLGCYDTELEAHNVFKTEKIKQAKILAERWKDMIDYRIYNILNNFESHIDTYLN